MNFDFSHGGRAARSGLEAIDVSEPIDYLFPNLKDDPEAKLPAGNSGEVIQALQDLADRMIEDSNVDTAEDNSTIPAGYTYWGQFIDHDITAIENRLDVDIFNADFEPRSPQEVVANMSNSRRPTLDLDSVYGDGPNGDARDFYMDDGIRLKVGNNVPAETTPSVPGQTPNPDLGLERDLVREDQPRTIVDGNGNEQTITIRKAIIGDSRNDENTIISQFHLAMIKFHNAVADALGPGTLFEQARQVTTWHYQWLVVNDFLKAITLPGIVDHILLSQMAFPRTEEGDIFMPLEFSVAAYRFGHSMVRNQYDFNRNFNHTPDAIVFRATFEELFIFTGSGGSSRNPFRGEVTLPSNWIIEWERFFDHHSPIQERFTRKVDTNIAMAMEKLDNHLTDAAVASGMVLSGIEREITRHLAKRNLLRGYLLSIPTGQKVAETLGVTPLTMDELRPSGDGGVDFSERTPLWYYILKEAEIQANGNCLGEVGSHIVAQTLIGLLRNDPNSYLNHGWDPSRGVRGENGKLITTIADLLRFAKVMV